MNAHQIAFCLEVAGDIFVALIYFVIPVLLHSLWQQLGSATKPTWATRALLWSACVFIGSCGVSHALTVLSIWVPLSWPLLAMKCITALSALVTAVYLARVVPAVLFKPSPIVNRSIALRVRAENMARSAGVHVQG